MPNAKGSVIVSDIDRALLIFLWQWKVATTRNLALRFFRDKNFRAAYVRLWKLERGGFIQSTSTADRKNHLWILSDHGFNSFIAPYLNLKQEGYKSEFIDHDFLVNAVHLGEWVLGVPQGVELFTEQQLRRLDPEFYPAWIPKSKRHRPDGYTLVANSNGTRLLAIEVEISQKKLEVYENYGRFYSEGTRVTDVVWVVASRRMAERINSRIQKAVWDRADIHTYFLASDIKIHGWNSRAVIGKWSGSPLSEVYCISPEQRLNSFSGVQFFDTRKTLAESERSTKLISKNL